VSGPGLQAEEEPGGRAPPSPLTGASVLEGGKALDLVQGYRAIGYARGEAPLRLRRANGRLTVDYDDVLRTLDHEPAPNRGDEFPEWVLR
jgi:hypothetical protein